MRLKIRCDEKSTVLLQNFLDLNWAQESLPGLLKSPSIAAQKIRLDIYRQTMQLVIFFTYI
jgi:hypothetical protein